MSGLLGTLPARAQLIDIKPWHGYYPEMEGSYPLSFVSFTGWLFPKPHFFVRTWPTHYYVETGAGLVYDTGTYANLLKINFLKIVFRLLEKAQMKDRQQASTGIRDNIQGQKEIEAQLFNSRADELPDIYGIAAGFVRLYQSLNRLDKLENCPWLKKNLEKEADDLLYRFISVNLLQTDHGQKLEAFSEIFRELGRQTGCVDYSYRKVNYYQFSNKNYGQSYSFLAE